MQEPPGNQPLWWSVVVQLEDNVQEDCFRWELHFCILQKMAMSILKGLVQGYLSSMLEEGVVTEHFYGMVSQRQAAAERNQIVQLVETYFADVDTSLSELSGHVDNSEVDFSVLASLARGIEDKSARIGAEHMRLACSDIIQACDQKNKNRFCETLPWLKNEFTNTRRKLSAYLEMENEIIKQESSQPPK